MLLYKASWIICIHWCSEVVGQMMQKCCAESGGISPNGMCEIPSAKGWKLWGLPMDGNYLIHYIRSGDMLKWIIPCIIHKKLVEDSRICAAMSFQSSISYWYSYDPLDWLHKSHSWNVNRGPWSETWRYKKISIDWTIIIQIHTSLELLVKSTL